jgi:formyltetrahydrofolate deformylase
MVHNSYILTFSCTDAVGIVAAVTGLLADQDGFILDSQQYADLDSGNFFMRVAFRGAGPRFPADLAGVETAFFPIIARFAMDARISDTSVKPRFLIAVSQSSHCLNDLLHRWSTANLAIDVAGVVSNHDSLRRLSEWHGLPFHYLPVSEANRAEQEAAILQVMADSGAQHLVLARYMQILSNPMTAALAGRAINIHHSFLPGFKGAKPYHRAHERGVKLIGATAHFVTADLDEGPIIEQAVERVDHRDTVDDLIRIGRDIEARVLARAVHMVAEQRVLIDGRKTVVFR